MGPTGKGKKKEKKKKEKRKSLGIPSLDVRPPIWSRHI